MDDPYANQLTKEEVQAFDAESRGLLRDVDHTLEALHTTQRQVAEISQLQEVLASHIAQQTAELVRVRDATVQTSENVRSGNEQLVSAVKHGADYRYGERAVRVGRQRVPAHRP